MSKKSKDIIAKTLIALMETNNFYEITISEVCDNTPLVRKTFYNNFSSKEDVIKYIAINLINEYFDSVKKLPSFSLKEISYSYFYFGKKNKKLISLLINNNLFYLFLGEFNGILPTINMLVPRNRLVNIPEKDLKYIYAFHSAGVNNMLKLWTKSDFEKTPEEMSELYYLLTQSVQF